MTHNYNINKTYLTIYNMSKAGSKAVGVPATGKAEPENKRKINVKTVVLAKNNEGEYSREEEPDTFTGAANRLYQDAKMHLEQSGNLKTAIKEAVIENLGKLYEIILKVNEDRLLQRARVHQLVARIEGGFNKELVEEIKEQREIARETREDIRKMREDMGKLELELKKKEEKEEGQRESETYAEKAAKNCNPVQTRGPAVQPIHSIVVSSEDTKDSSEDVITKIRTAVQARTTGIRVDRVRKARDQKVVIGCTSKGELEKVKEKLKSEQPRLKIEPKQNKDPLVIIKNVLNYNTDEDILTALRVQNAHITGHIKNEEYRASIRYKRRARNQMESHVVLQVSPSVWQALTEAGKLHIDLQRVVVQDQSPLIQCSRCLGYGHGRKLCTETADLCSHCGGPHLRAQCPIRLTGGSPTCHNCALAKLDKSEHNSFDEACPVRQKWDRLARAAVAYC